MVIDSSAVVAVILNEADAAHYERKIVVDKTRLISAVSLVEITMVSESRRDRIIEIDTWLAKTGIVIAPVDKDQADMACSAWRKYGKGRHKAGLNFGDCFSYALAKSRNEKLLFKGDDFSQTDIVVA